MFQSLTKKTKRKVKKIVDILLNGAFHSMLGGMHSEMGTCFTIMDEGYSPDWVVGPLQWTIMQLLKDNMIDWMLHGEINEGHSTIIDIDFKRGVMVMNGATMNCFKYNH